MKRVLVLTDVNAPVPPDYDFKDELKHDDYECEADVLKSLRRQGHEPRLVALFDSLDPLMKAVDEFKPEVVFNLVEAFRNDRDHEPHLAGMLELLGIPHTGANATALTLCKDKALAKKILDFHRIKTPKFKVSTRVRPFKRLRDLRFPVFVKPLTSEGSEGITLDALCEDEQSALERMRFLHESQQTDVLIEEFVAGRELYAGVLGNERMQVLPLIELFVANAPLGAEDAPEGAPRFFTYHAKWNRRYRRKWQIRAGPPHELPDAISKKIADITRRVCRVLRIKGYGRLDLRLTPEGEIYVIEANPNPSVASGDELAKAAARAEIDYDTLISRILSFAVGT